MKKVIKWIKLNERAKMPSKKEGDMGYDLYPIVDDDFLVIRPHHHFRLKTGLAYILPENWHFLIKERTSTGKLNINCIGVADNSYTGELNLFLQNDNNVNLILFKGENKDEFLELKKELYYKSSVADHYLHKDLFANDGIFYSLEKAICQAIPVYSEDFETIESTIEELREKESVSHRKDGKEGSSKK